MIDVVVEFNSSAIVIYCLKRSSAVFEGISKVVVGYRIIWIDLYSRSQVFESLFVPFKLNHRVSEIVESLYTIGTDSGGLLQNWKGLLEFTNHSKSCSKVDVGISILFVNFYGVSIADNGLLISERSTVFISFEFVLLCCLFMNNW